MNEDVYENVNENRNGFASRACHTVRMRIVADTHVHSYPFYDLPRQLGAAVRNLSHAAPDATVRLLCLTERAGQYVFEALASGDVKAPGWTISPAGDGSALTAMRAEHECLTVLPGRQFVTAERIEVLALGRDLRIEDGLPLDVTLARVREQEVTPVLPWGLGKWWGARGRLVRNVLDTSAPGDVVFADTCLRPALFPTPALLRKARSRGFLILYGSDPLPRPGEEELTGLWASQWEADWDPAHPAATWRRLMRDPAAKPVGRRCSMGEAFSRLW